MTHDEKSDTSGILFFANTDWYLFNFRSALIRAASDAGYEVACVSPPGIHGKRLQDSGFEWQALPFERDSRYGMLRSLLRTRNAIRRAVQERQPSIVHSFTLTSILLTWLAVPRGMAVRRVNAVTGMGYAFTGHSLKHRLIRTVLGPLIGRALEHPDAWTVVQNATDRDIVRQAFGVAEDRLRLIPGSGVDVDRFRSVSREGDRPLRVGFVGRLLTDKGIREFVEAAQTLAGRFPEVEFVAAGEPDAGNPAAVSAEELTKWKRNGSVKFLGQVEDMPGFLNTLDLFVLPSYREGLSRSLIEAGACGLPAVTTDVPGCRDVVTDGENGRVVPVRDAGALAGAIGELLADDALRARMGRKAREVIEAGFSNERVNGETVRLYGEVLGKQVQGESA